MATGLRFLALVACPGCCRLKRQAFNTATHARGIMVKPGEI
jgi:hypothetical protein